MEPIETSTVTVSRRSSVSILDENLDCTVVWLSGEHDIATAEAVGAALRTAVALDDADIVVDLSGVQFMASAVVTVFLQAETLLRSQGRELRLRRPSRSARRIVELCGLQTLLEPDPSIDRATGPAGALGTWVFVPRADLVEEPGNHVSSKPDSSRPDSSSILAALPCTARASDGAFSPTRSHRAGE